MDAADEAQLCEALLRDAALSKLGQTARTTQEGDHCLRCGFEIDARRREALPGCCLCFECQEMAEGLAK